MYIFLATGATGRENEMTTGGNYLILLPAPTALPLVEPIRFNIPESGNFSPLPPSGAGSSVSA